jgi:hypothetical protein
MAANLFKWMSWSGVTLIWVVDLQLVAQTPDPRMIRAPIIDAHWHSTIAPGDLRTQEAFSKRRAAIRVMDSLGVGHVLVSGTPDGLAVWREELGNRAIPALLFPCESGQTPNFGRKCFSGDAEFPDAAWLRGEIKAGRIKALGEITAQYLGIPPNDTRLEPYYALAEELDVPVLIHLGFGPPAAAYPSSPVPRKSPNFRAAAGSPFLLEDVLLRHKRLRVLVMHGGWPLIDEMVAILYYHPQVYIDFAGLQSLIPRAAFYAAFKTVVEAGFADRIMFGSDGTDNGVDWLPRGIDAVMEASFLSDAQRRDILYNNASRFFRLNPVR